MEELTPNTRYEKFLAAAAGNEQRPDPVTRDEKFLAALSGDYSAPDPVTRDEKMLAYAAGTSPTTGAEVVDLGGAETTYQLTPTQISLLTGQNYVWADTGDVTVKVKGAKTSA